MNIDQLVKWIVFPIVKYPIILCLLFGSNSRWIQGACVAYSVLLSLFLWLNTQYKCYGATKWVSMNHIESPIVVITGGSNGLGLSITKELLIRFPRLTVLNIDLDISPIKDERIKNYKCDLRDSAARNKIIDEVKRASGGKVHLIINNAGMRSNFQNAKKIQDQDLDSILAVNFFAPVKLMQGLIPLENGPNQCYVINIASTLAILSPAKVASYASSKAALTAFHKSYSFELENRKVSNIRTLLVVPGQLNTKLFGGFKPPRQFFAPVIYSDVLARQIIRCCETGQRGDLYAPFYSNFAHLLMSLPYIVQLFARKFSNMDNCLPDN